MVIFDAFINHFGMEKNIRVHNNKFEVRQILGLLSLSSSKINLDKKK